MIRFKAKADEAAASDEKSAARKPVNAPEKDVEDNGSALAHAKPASRKNSRKKTTDDDSDTLI